MRLFAKLLLLLSIAVTLIHCKNEVKNPEANKPNSDIQVFVEKVSATYEGLAQHEEQFTFGEKSSPTSIFYGNEKTFEIFTNAGGCTTNSCPMTRFKNSGDTLYQEMLGRILMKSIDKNPIITIQEMNGYIPLPPQLYLRYHNGNMESLAQGLSYEKLLHPKLHQLIENSNSHELLLNAENGTASAFFNKETYLLDSLKMDYIPLNVATEITTKISVVFDRKKTVGQDISYDFSRLKKAERPLEIFSQWNNGKELKASENLERVTDFTLQAVASNSEVSFKELVKGKNTIISIWSTDFAPATWNIRDLNKLKNEIGDSFDGLQLFGIAKYNENLSVESIKKFKKVYDIDIPSYYTKENYFQNLKVPSYPAYIVINSKGEVVNTYFGYDTKEIVNLKSDLKEMFKS